MPAAGPRMSRSEGSMPARRATASREASLATRSPATAARLGSVAAMLRLRRSEAGSAVDANSICVVASPAVNSRPLMPEGETFATKWIPISAPSTNPSSTSTGRRRSTMRMLMSSTSARLSGVALGDRLQRPAAPRTRTSASTVAPEAANTSRKVRIASLTSTPGLISPPSARPSCSTWTRRETGMSCRRRGRAGSPTCRRPRRWRAPRPLRPSAPRRTRRGSGRSGWPAR